MILELVLISTVAAADKAAVSVSEGSPTPVSVSGVPTPECLPIQLTKKGEVIKKEMIPSSVSDTELLARLVYAETRAANCPAQKGRVHVGAAHVILNRVDVFKREGRDQPVKRTVFGSKQFASSLHKYSKSQWDAFRCPPPEELDFYRNVYQTVEKIQSGEIDRKPYQGATHYYLHRHFDKYQDHPWGKSAKKIETIGGDCLGLYKVDEGFLDAAF